MSRKKKVDTTVENKKEEKKNTNSSIAYSGSVTVSHVNKNGVVIRKTVHNQGTNTLFKYLIMYISGNGAEYVEDCMPQSIQGYNTSTGQEVPVFYKKWNKDSSDYAIDENSNWYTTFEFTIPYTQMSAGSQINKLKLFNGRVTDVDNPLAIVNLTSPIEIDGKSNLIIEWKMTLTNK